MYLDSDLRKKHFACFDVVVIYLKGGEVAVKSVKFHICFIASTLVVVTKACF